VVGAAKQDVTPATEVAWFKDDPAPP
jgi:hypothetical protein